jgi:phosphatidylinositol 4-kinase
MQEPEIFEQPVANRDPEAHTPADEHGTYSGVYGNGVYSNGLGPGAAADDASDDYHDFVYPEGWSLFFSLFVVGEQVK